MTTHFFTFTFRSSGGAVYDPSDVTVTISDPTGTTQATLSKTNLTRVSTGVYQLNYTLPNSLQGCWGFSVSTSSPLVFSMWGSFNIGGATQTNKGIFCY